METTLTRMTTNEEKLVLISLIPQDAALQPSLIPQYKTSLNYHLQYPSDIILNQKKGVLPSDRNQMCFHGVK